MSVKTLAEKLRDVAEHLACHNEYGYPVCLIADLMGIGCSFRTRAVAHCEYACTAEVFESIADEIERDYIERPRFEDGEAVQFGDKVSTAGSWLSIMGTETIQVDSIAVDNNGMFVLSDDNHGTISYMPRENIERPPSKECALEDIEKDASDEPAMYCKKRGLKGTYSGSTDNCRLVMIRDLLRRQREALERGGNGEG